MSWQLDGLELNKTALDTVEAKKLAQRLREVTGQTEHYFSQDVRVTARLLAYLLAFESHQQGFGLTATQDAHFNEVSCDLCPLFHGPAPRHLLPSLLIPDPQLITHPHPRKSEGPTTSLFPSSSVLLPLGSWLDPLIPAPTLCTSLPPG